MTHAPPPQRVHAASLLPLLLVLLAGPAEAQRAWDLQPGMRVRLHVMDTARAVSTTLTPIERTGTVARATLDSIYLIGRRRDTISVDVNAVQKVYRSGKRSRVQSAVALGLAGGIVFGLVGNDRAGKRGAERGLMLGLATGAFYGWSRPYEQWDQIRR